MRLFLVRHGQTEWNASRRAQGHTDIDLDEAGLRQAKALELPFSQHPVAAVYTSDLKRSFRTAEFAAKGADARLIVDCNLRERCFGEWEGLPFEEVGTRIAALGDPFLACSPGGESLQAVWDRVSTFVEELNDCNEDVALVSHGGTCAILLARLLKGTLQTSRCFRFGNASITELERRTGHYTMLRYNDVSHLDAPALGGDVDGSRA